MSYMSYIGHITYVTQMSYIIYICHTYVIKSKRIHILEFINRWRSYDVLNIDNLRKIKTITMRLRGLKNYKN